jgi:hypothetical protein
MAEANLARPPVFAPRRGLVRLERVVDYRLRYGPPPKARTSTAPR